MIGLSLDLKAGGPTGRWWLGEALRIDAANSGTIAPAMVADFRRNRYAAPTGLTPAQILAASLSDLQAAVRRASLADVFAFTRLSAATFIDAGGVPRIAGENVPRFETANGKRRLLLEGPATNVVTRSSHTAGAPWPASRTDSGITATLVRTGMAGDIAFADFALTGTATSTSAEPVVPSFYSAAAGGTVAGDMWTASLFVQLISGNWPSGITIGAGVHELDSGAAVLAGSIAGLQPSPSAKRQMTTRTLSNAATSGVRSSIQIHGTGLTGLTFSGQVIRLYGWQLEKSTIATSLVPTVGTTATRAADNCRLTSLAAATLRRSGAGLVLQAGQVWGSGGRIVGGASYSRLIGFNGTSDTVVLGANAPVGLATVSAPLPDFGVAAGWDAAGKAGSYQSGYPTVSTAAIDTDISALYVGRDGDGHFATGFYDRLTTYPARPANAALQTKAVAYD